MIKINKNSVLYIWIPSKNVISGGAEQLNFLASVLKKFGVNAKCFNFEYNLYLERNNYYTKLYDIDGIGADDIPNEENSIILFPEYMIYTAHATDGDLLKFYKERFSKCQFIFWLMSTSFHDSQKSLRMIYNDLKEFDDKGNTLFVYEQELGKRDLEYFSGIKHFLPLQHGIHEAYYNVPIDLSKKKNIILYNAFKSGTCEYVEKLKPYLNDIEFKCISYNGVDGQLFKEEMCEQYDQCKVFIDFCEFDGRELTPREAVQRNCILYVGDNGDAACFNEYPIPDYYKINKFDDPQILADKIRKSFDNYYDELNEFQIFKNKIRLDTSGFLNTILMLFKPMITKNISIYTTLHNGDINISYSCFTN